MLVLTRKNNEAIHIGEEIVVKVVAIEGNSVRLGIEAPTNIPIVRQELIAEVTQQNIEASQPRVDRTLLAQLKAKLTR